MAKSEGPDPWPSLLSHKAEVPPARGTPSNSELTLRVQERMCSHPRERPGSRQMMWAGAEGLTSEALPPAAAPSCFSCLRLHCLLTCPSPSARCLRGALTPGAPGWAVPTALASHHRQL